MNIKSDFLKEKIPLIKDISYQRFLAILMSAAVLASIIVAIGQAFWFKLIITLVGVGIILVSADDQKSEDRPEHYRKWFGSLFILWLLLEIPLGLTAMQTKTENLYTERAPIAKDANLSAPVEVSILFFNSDTLEQVDTRTALNTEPEKLKLFESVVGKETYIDYFPFLKYEEAEKYIHKG